MASSWVDSNQTSKLQSYEATGIFRTHYLNFKLKQPWSGPNQINPTQNYKATAIFKGNIFSRSKSDFQTPKLQSYRHISNTLPEFQTQTALIWSKSDQPNPKLQSYTHFQRQHLELIQIRLPNSKATKLQAYFERTTWISNSNSLDLIQIRST